VCIILLVVKQLRFLHLGLIPTIPPIFEEEAQQPPLYGGILMDIRCHQNTLGNSPSVLDSR
jgi:hypothetical protein